MTITLPQQANHPITEIIQRAEVVISCAVFNDNLQFFTEVLGFKVDSISPADDPRFAQISGFGQNIQLQFGEDPIQPITLRLLFRGDGISEKEERIRLAPNGTRIALVPVNDELDLPPICQSFVTSHLAGPLTWNEGRAGMSYRDLIPGRQGGRFIASHIRIEKGGPVADYNHYHNVRFQMIYCYKGWVRVAYQGQGPDFVLYPGDCVTQPPGIRHRVMECSPGLEVIEISCPGEHQTYADHDIQLPEQALAPDRLYAEQRFVHHERGKSQWGPWRLTGFEALDMGIAQASQGLAGAFQVRPCQSDVGAETVVAHDEEFLFLFVLKGQVNLLCESFGENQLSAGDACVIPAGHSHALLSGSEQLEFLEVRMSAEFSLVSEPMDLQALQRLVG
jgi:quercetin dioxygenase-like cupin family protein